MPRFPRPCQGALFLGIVSGGFRFARPPANFDAALRAASGAKSKCLREKGKSAAITRMPESTPEIELHIVVQFGGSSGEQYLHTFTTESLALKYMRSAGESSYRCLGPFQIALPGIPRLTDAAKKTVEWLNANGFRDTPLANNLNSALAQVEREYPMS